jgi:diketogulonate reductase-like aldo/keto reductase
MTKALTLRSGATMPAVGLGTWKVPKEATSDAVFEAIKMGYEFLKFFV